MEKLSRQEAYAESEEIYSEIRKEFEEFLKKMKPKVKILTDFADKHNLVVKNPLELYGDLDGSQHYVGRNFSTVSEGERNVNRDVGFEYLDSGYDGCWISSSDLC